MRRITVVLASAIIFMTACTDHFIPERSFRKEVLEDLAARQFVLDASGIDLDAMELETIELEALQFMYAYMPLGDIVNRPVEFYLDQYNMVKKAMREMPWGKIVPERELRHFVLPVRVNNENLDSARYVFYQELAPRVCDMSMEEAVLEVNHWCHEKAVYMPSDRRTSSPLATVKTAYGRCGEESTLLVAALRSVGIPARQVYTPRWAHTDSNHAWVEAWVEGQWRFLGACEPEPVLDLGWFNAPASRGMLMHTKVFGRYDGPEEVVKVTPNYTEINVIENYAPEFASVCIKVLDCNERPVEDARVSFQIYNYSEFSPVATKMTGKDGTTSLTAGLGDMIVYASKDGKFGLSEVTYGKDESVSIVLQYSENSDIPHMEMTLVPPVENAQLPEVTDEMRAENTCRMEYEDSLRNAYVSTFMNAKKSAEFALKHNLDVDRTSHVLVASRGNHSEIACFLSDAASKGMGARALDLLLSLAEKDLRDTPAYVLADHLYNTPVDADVDRVLCPRVSSELFTSYRSYLQTAVPESLADSLRRDPALLVKWCKDNLTLCDDISMAYVQLTPERVWETRLTDTDSREIFFVAMCRSFGVPAWLDPVTDVIKYEKDGLVYDVDFVAAAQQIQPKGYLRLEYDQIPMLDNPKYESHFTISKFDGTQFRVLNYHWTESWASLFKEPRQMDCGYYMLVSGSRMADGSVFSDVEFFTVNEGETTVAELVMRDAEDQVRVVGSFDSEIKYMSLDSDRLVEKSVLQTTGRGYFAVALVDYGTEPTNHAFMDFSAVAQELQSWGRPILVVFATEEDYRKFRPDHFGLPSNVHFGIDVDGRMRNMVASEMELDKRGTLPLILVADTFNRVVFFSQGYSIGLGESLVKLSKAL